MSYQRGYKYALRLSGAQRRHFAKEFGASRFVFNTLLSRHAEEHKHFKDGNGEKPVTSYFSLTKKLIGLKREFPFLQDNSVYTLRSGTANLAGALRGFLSGKSRYPKFKSRNRKQSVTYYYQNTKIYEFRLVPVEVNGKTVLYLKAPKLKEPIKILWHRPLPSTPKQVTISRDTSGNFYASFLCEREGILTNGDGIVGIDLGLKDIVTSSDGTVLPAPRFLRKAERRLAIAQRKLAKKKRGSKNRYKQRRKVAKIYRKIANARQHYLHEVSRKLVNENQVIGAESLRVASMMKALKLGKSVADAGLGTLIRFIQYKAEESGHCLVIMYPTMLPSTQVCSNCYYRLTGDKRLKLSDRQWTCPKCNTQHDRDVNAARVIREGTIRHRERLPESLKHRHGTLIVDGAEFGELFPESLAVA